MYAAVVREGEEVFSPTGRRWLVVGRGEGGRIALRCPWTGDMVELHPRLLRHAGSFLSGELLDHIYTQ